MVIWRNMVGPYHQALRTAPRTRVPDLLDGSQAFRHSEPYHPWNGREATSNALLSHTRVVVDMGRQNRG